MPTTPENIFAPQLLVKQPGERLKYAMDFTSRIETGVTIQSFEITSETVGNEESSLIIEDAVVEGKKVLFFISGGTNALNYTIDVIAELSNDETIIGSGMLRIIKS